MKSALTILWLLLPLLLSAQPEFTMKSGEQLSHMNQYGQSTQQLEAFIAANPSRLYDQSEALLLISYNYMQLGDYVDALAANEASLRIKAHLHADDLVNNYVRYGAIHLLRGNFHTALAYLLRAKNYPIEAVQLYAVIDGYLAAAYQGLGQFHQAETHYRQSIETLLIEYPEDHVDVIISYYNLGELYLKQGKPETAESYFKRGMERIKPSTQEGFLQALFYNGVGKCFPQDPRRAEVYHRKALEVAGRYFGNYHRETAQAGILLARALYQQDRRDEAKEAIQMSIRSLSPEQPGLLWEQVPDTNNIVIDRTLLAEALGLKAAWLEDSALPDAQKLPMALAHSELAGKVLSAALDDQLDQADRLKLLPVAKTALEPGIAAGIRLWQQHGSVSALYRAFQLVELAKMLEFRSYTGHVLELKGSYADKERESRRMLQLVEMNFRLQPMDITARKAVIRAQADYQQLRRTWQQAEPAVYQERFGLPVLPHTDVQGQLPPNAALLSYFVGSNKLYLFALSREDLQAFVLVQDDQPKDETRLEDQLAGHVGQLLQSIDSSDVAGFSDHAYGWYQQLLAPAASWLKNKAQLVILPDGPLRDIPFETLLSKPAAKKPAFHKLSYLLDDFEIHYHHAASVWGANTASGKVSPAYELLFISPVFDEDRVARIESSQQMLFDPNLHPASPISNGRRFKLLSQADSHARQLEDIFIGAEQKSLVQLREAATESFLKQAFANAHYIHLASYGFVQGPSPEEAGLLLATPDAKESTEDDGLLLASELSTLPLFSTDLLTIDLTTFGEDELSRPAGITPLSGSLMLAGIPNLLYTTRSESSSLLFPLFYEQLLKGRSMGQSLQAAKKSLIKQKETAAPKFWSGYRLLGR